MQVGSSQDHDAAGAQKFAALAEGIEIHVHLLGLFSGQDEGGRSAGNYGLELSSVGDAATNVINHLLQRIAEGQFVNARLVDVSAQAEEACAAVLGWAIVGKLLAAHKNNVGNGRQSLNVIDDRRAAP